MKYKVSILFLSISLFLFGCSYSDGCFFMPQSVHCFNQKSDIERYKKNVSHKQKIQDFKNCGAVPDKEGNYIKSLVKKAEQEGLRYNYFYVKKVYNCMLTKGYKLKE